MKPFAALVPALLLLAGCATVETVAPQQKLRTDGDKPLKSVISVENYGYYLFGFIPLIGGDPAYPNENRTACFRETVTLQRNMDMLADEARRIKAKDIVNLKSEVDWTGSFSFWVFWRKTVYTSADALGE